MALVRCTCRDARPPIASAIGSDPESSAVRLRCSICICLPAASAMNSLIPLEAQHYRRISCFAYLPAHTLPSLRRARICFIRARCLQNTSSRIEDNSASLRDLLITQQVGRIRTFSLAGFHRCKSTCAHLLGRRCRMPATNPEEICHLFKQYMAEGDIPCVRSRLHAASRTEHGAGLLVAPLRLVGRRLPERR